MKEKRLLFIAHDALPYGANQSLMNIVSFLISRGVFVVVVFPKKGVVCDIFENNGWDYHVVNFRNELRPKITGLKNLIKVFFSFCRKIYFNKKAVKSISNLIERNNINIIHSNSGVVSIGADLSNKLNIKHVWHLRELIHPNYGLYVFEGLNHYIKRLHFAKNILCVSGVVSKKFQVEENGTVLYDAVRSKVKYNASQPKGKYFLFCGTLHRNKGVEEAISAFRIVLSDYPGYKLLIVGEGTPEYEQYLKELTVKYELERDVDFLGFRKDIDDLMANALAFLMCSRNEALGRVTVEAMLNFCLVFGYDDGGTSEIIKHNETGFLYNQIEELVKLMIEVIKDNSQFDVLREQANLFACSNFLEEAFGEKLLKYYDNLK